MTYQGDRKPKVINNMQDAQAKQMEVMTGFMKAMTELIVMNTHNQV